MRNGKRAIYCFVDLRLFERYMERFEYLHISFTEHLESMLLAEMGKSNDRIANDLGRRRTWVAREGNGMPESVNKEAVGT